jgi:hypothetical protein
MELQRRQPAVERHSDGVVVSNALFSSRAGIRRLKGRDHDHLLSNCPVCGDFSSLLDCAEPDLKAVEMHYMLDHA